MTKNLEIYTAIMFKNIFHLSNQEKLESVEDFSQDAPQKQVWEMDEEEFERERQNRKYNSPMSHFMNENVAQVQRDKPEKAMLNIQFVMGGGVLNGVVEHLGDLTHRMSESVTSEYGG